MGKIHLAHLKFLDGQNCDILYYFTLAYKTVRHFKNKNNQKHEYGSIVQNPSQLSI